MEPVAIMLEKSYKSLLSCLCEGEDVCEGEEVCKGEDVCEGEDV